MKEKRAFSSKKIHIKDDLYFCIDEHQYILYRSKGVKGKEVFDGIGYYQNLDNLVEKLIKLESIKTKADNFEDFLIELKENRQTITNLLASKLEPKPI